jgi:hypothetical protein
MVHKTTHGKLKFTTKEIIAIFSLPPFHLNVAQHSGSTCRVMINFINGIKVQ